MKENSTKQLAIIAVAVIVLLAIIAAVYAIVANNSEDLKVAGAQEQQEVTVEGANLPPDSDAQGNPISAEGQTAPVVLGKSFTGETVEIKHDGRAKALFFFTHTCSHCDKEMPIIASWLKTNKTKYPDVQFQAISSGAVPNGPNYPPSSWFKKHKWTLPVLVDNRLSSAGDAYGLTAFPYYVILDGEGKVLTRQTGEQPIENVEKWAQQAQASVKK